MYVKFPWHTVGRQSMAIMAMPVEEAWYFYDLFTSLAISSCMNNLLCTFQTEACSLDWRWRKQNYRPISLASPTPFTIDQLPQAENQNLPLSLLFTSLPPAGFNPVTCPSFNFLYKTFKNIKVLKEVLSFHDSSCLS